jgi:hypothetical protein
MRLRVALIGCFLAIGAVAIGFALVNVNSSTAGSGDDSCVTQIRNTLSRIKPLNGGYTCAQIKSFLLVLPNAVGKWPIESSSSNRDLICHVYPRRALPLEVRCQRGSREFEIVSATS